VTLAPMAIVEGYRNIEPFAREDRRGRGEAQR
jgi:hypothetical protein